MALPLNSLYCPIRKQAVCALPEEQVRQRILKHMIEELGFPHSLIVVEKSLSQLPHLSAKNNFNIPDRRADIICFAKEIHPSFPLYPLLTIECKAVNLNKRVMNQVIGYNYFINSLFIGVVNAVEFRLGWYDKEKDGYQFINYLPNFNILLKAAKG